jgi:L-seryl-tRNA(Ser) seleniumtransferase
MEQLPQAGDLPNEIVMARTHRNGYDRALRTAGAVIRDVGVNDRGTGAGIRGLEAWELDAAIGPKTVAIAFSANRATLDELPMVVEVAARHKLPVIVDAAAQLPPKANLQRFIADGASLVAYSGGKAIGGPQASGILAGRRDLVASALLQQVDMDVDPGAFTAPAEFFGNSTPPALPRHGIGRGFKASKEAIVGFLTALDLFLAQDDAAKAEAMQVRLDRIAQRLSGFAGVTTALVPAGIPRAYPRLALTFEAASGVDSRDMARRLRLGRLPLYLAEERIAERVLIVDLISVAEADDETLVDLIREALAK